MRWWSSSRLSSGTISVTAWRWWRRALCVWGTPPYRPGTYWGAISIVSGWSSRMSVLPEHSHVVHRVEPFRVARRCGNKHELLVDVVQQTWVHCDSFVWGVSVAVYIAQCTVYRIILPRPMNNSLILIIWGCGPKTRNIYLINSYFGGGLLYPRLG